MRGFYGLKSVDEVGRSAAGDRSAMSKCCVRATDGVFVGERFNVVGSDIGGRTLVTIRGHRRLFAAVNLSSW